MSRLRVGRNVASRDIRNNPFPDSDVIEARVIALSQLRLSLSRWPVIFVGFRRGSRASKINQALWNNRVSRIVIR